MNIRITVILLLISVVCYSQMTPKPYVSGQLYGYLEYLPKTYIPKNDYECGQMPVIIFLHGIGEKGYGDTTSLKLLYKHGPPRLIKSGTWTKVSGDRFIVIAPQCPANFFNPSNLRKFIDLVKLKYNVDPDRIYITGLSAGAFSIWNYVYKYQDQIAAAIPIAGSGTSVTVDTLNNCKMATVPIWAFHGDKDTQVTFKGSINPVSRINKCKVLPKAKVTIYAGIGHDSWSRTYDLSGMNSSIVLKQVTLDRNLHILDPYDISIYDWLLMHKKWQQ